MSMSDYIITNPTTGLKSFKLADCCDAYNEEAVADRTYLDAEMDLGRVPDRLRALVEGDILASAVAESIAADLVVECPELEARLTVLGLVAA